MEWTLAKMLLLKVTLTLVFLVAGGRGGTEEEAQQWLNDIEKSYSDLCYETVTKTFEFGINMTPENHQAAGEAGNKFALYNMEIHKTVRENFSNWREFQNKRLRRAFKFVGRSGTGNMSLERVQRMNQIHGQMQMSFITSTVCEYNQTENCKLTLRDLEDYLKSEKDPEKLEYYWTAWHDKISSAITPELYHEFIMLLNERANANGFQDQTETLSIDYDDETESWMPIDFQRMLVQLAKEIFSLYDILHAYVRMKLRQIPEYEGMIDKCGYLPIHILGNMWAQEWSVLHDITKPYPNSPTLDATQAMKDQGYTPLKIFQEADRFFQDLGLMGMSEDFWEKSALEKPTDGRQVQCLTTAFDTCKGKGNTDFRIRHCTAITQRDLFIAHHEMGHVEYYQQYTDLEFIFRNGANPGFHEAIGDSLALSVITPKHLQCKLNLNLGFPQSFCDQDNGPFNTTEADINYLYLMGLEKLAFFPFGYAMDFWRWRVYEGKIPVEDYNKMWWKIRQDFQGIKTPSIRARTSLNVFEPTLSLFAPEPKGFDPASKYHIPANIDYLRYFISFMLQFQFYEAMCIAAKEYDPNDPNSKPIHQCDISGSKEAGALIGDMMKMGFAQGWRDVLEKMTGSREFSVAPMKNYLQPLLDYMEQELKANGETIGFGDSCEEVEQRNGTGKWSQLIPEELWAPSEEI